MALLKLQSDFFALSQMSESLEFPAGGDSKEIRPMWSFVNN